MKKKIGTLLTMLLFSIILSMNVGAASSVAKIGSKTYSTLPKAFSAVKSGQTITLTKNVSISGDLAISLGSKKVTLKLNKKTLKVSKNLNLKKGSLTIVGSGTIKAKEIKNAGTLTIQSGTITGSVYNTGKFNMKGGTLKYTKGIDHAIKTKGGSVTISGGTVKYQKPFDWEAPGTEYGDEGFAELNNGSAIITRGKAKVSITGGKIVSTSCIILTGHDSKSTISISGGTMENNGGCFAILGADNMTISGGKVNSGESIAYLLGDGTLQIKGGTFSCTWTMIESFAEGASVTISGGTFTTTMNSDPGNAAMFCVHNNKAKINIKAGTFKGTNNAYAFWTYGKPNKKLIVVSDKAVVKTKNVWKNTQDVCE